MGRSKGKANLKVEDVRQLYRDPKYPGSFGGVNKFLLGLKQGGHKIKKEELEKWLNQDDLYLLHKPSWKTFPRRPFIVQGIDHLWQADLSDVSSLKRYNRGHRFLLFIIDAFSKYGWVAPIKDKTAKTLTRVMENILTRSKRRPLHLQSDKGSEFVNRQFKAMLQKRGVKFYTSQNEETKAAFVERLQRTFKTKMYRFFTHARTLKYLDVLEDLMASYNNTFHRSIGMAPIEVTKKNEGVVRQRLSQHWRKAKSGGRVLKKGQEVRLSEARHAFSKGYLPQWSEEIFTIHKVLDTKPITYQVADEKGDVLLGTFYRQELQIVPTTKDRAFWVEKVLKTRKRGKRKQLFVKWSGYPNSFNSWIWEDDYV